MALKENKATTLMDSKMSLECGNQVPVGLSMGLLKENRADKLVVFETLPECRNHVPEGLNVGHPWDQVGNQEKRWYLIRQVLDPPQPV